MYWFDSRVRYSETDEKGLLSLAGIVDYFQDTSTFQSEDLGIGVSYLQSRNLVWVLAAWQIDVCEYPRLGEPIRTGTFPYEFKGFIGMRNFLMEDMRGKRLAEANSVWVLMDFKNDVPCRATEEMIGKYALEERLKMDYMPRKIALPAEGAEMEAIEVSRQHLDGNHHVNNGQYVHIAMGVLPDNRPIRRMRAEYRKQAHLHDILYPVVYEQGDRTVVSLQGEDKSPFAVVEFVPYQ